MRAGSGGQGLDGHNSAVRHRSVPRPADQRGQNHFFRDSPRSGLSRDSALKVDRAVAAANEAYDAYRVKSAIAARQALFTDQQPSVGLTRSSTLARGLTGDSALTRYPGTVTLPTASSASDGVDWSWFGLGAGMTALLAAGIAGVVLTTRRRGGIALP